MTSREEETTSDEDEQRFTLKTKTTESDINNKNNWYIKQIFEKIYTETNIVTFTIEYFLYLPKISEHFFRISTSRESLIIDVYRAFETNISGSIITHEIVTQSKIKITNIKQNYIIYNGDVIGHNKYDTDKDTLPIILDRTSKQSTNFESSGSYNPFSEFEFIKSFVMPKCMDKVYVDSVVDNVTFEKNHNSIQRNELNTINNFNSYKSKPSGSDFSLKTFIDESKKIVFNNIVDHFQKSLYPHQRPLPFIRNFSFFPFFFNSGDDTFLARPIVETSSTLPNPGKIELLPTYEKLYPVPEKRFDHKAELSTIVNPALSTGTRRMRGVFSGTPTAITNSPSGSRAPLALSANGSLMGFSDRRFETASLVPSLTPSIPKWIDQIAFATRAIEKLKFEIHYHPYVCHFIHALNKDGIPGLLSLDSQQLHRHLSVLGFIHRYRPNSDIVATPYPHAKVDFELDGAYSIYNWELFFHIPLLIATRLMLDQRFEDARTWFHYIFNPTDSSTPDPQKPWQRYWKMAKFRETEPERLADLLRVLSDTSNDAEVKQRRAALEDQIDDWRENSFQPHRIARLRLMAYQKSVVMKYIDNLIQWGDRLFRQDTIESINEATQLYLLAQSILGPRPQRLPELDPVREQTFHEIKGRLDQFGNALVPLEEAFSVAGGGTHGASWELLSRPGISYGDVQIVSGAPAALVSPEGLTWKAMKPKSAADGSSQYASSQNKPPPYSPAVVLAAADASNARHQTFYFCIPQNDILLGYWDTVADRLFKIRHCMNIEGVVRQLPLYEPPIDPALLVQAAAMGIDIGSVLDDLSAPLPYYRFEYMVQKALDLCSEVKSLGGLLLSVLEKRDAEALSNLRATQELGLLKLVSETRVKQYEEAVQNQGALVMTKAVIGEKMTFYAARVKEEEENKRLPEEEAQLEQLAKGEGFEIEARENEKTGANIARYTPDVSVGCSGLEATFSATAGRHNIISYYDGNSRTKRNDAAACGYSANRSSILGQWTRRDQDFQLQYDLAVLELKQIEQQITAAEIRVQIAWKELTNHEQQMENAAAVEEFLRAKFTNQELYSWMKGRISGLFFQTYKLAYDQAKRAEKALQHEHGLSSTNYIKFGYWDSLRNGLLAGEQLHHDLKRLELAHLDKNQREYELTKHISLASLDPLALIKLRETGECDVNLPEIIFDLDFPGHYMRRIKSVSLSIPCVTGPYTGMNCTLTLLGNHIRQNTGIGGGYACTDLEDSRFKHNLGAVQSIAISGAQNDSGLFELNFRDERYLPFEGAGVISDWRLELSGKWRLDAGELVEFPQFDFNTISDVIIHLKYTAREGGKRLKTEALSSLQKTIKDIEEFRGLSRLFSARHEFPNQWYQFLHPADTASSQTLQIDLKQEHFPFLFQGKTITIKQVDLFLKIKDKTDPKSNESYLTLYQAAPLSINFSTGSTFENMKLTSDPAIHVIPQATITNLEIKTPSAITLEAADAGVVMIAGALRDTVTVGNVEHYRLKPEVFEDLFILCQYTVSDT